MPEVAVFSQNSSQSGTLKLKDEVFGAPVHQAVLHDSVVNYLANRRRGTASTKTRGEVSGGGKKPWKQKGTGRARQGSTRAPQWIHGGIAFGPKPRDYSYRLPEKVRKLALRSALSVKQAEGNLIVLDDMKLETVKTKSVFGVLKSLKVEKLKVLLVLPVMDEKIKISGRNIPNLALALAAELHPYPLLWADKVICTRAAVAKIEEALD